MALENFKNEKKFHLKIEPLENLKSCFQNYFKFNPSCSIGALVVPSIQENFGPMYICKISKMKK